MTNLRDRNRRYLEPLLEYYWLRPETAVWRALDCLALDDIATFESPVADIGCGDGLFSFIYAGGRIDMTYDAFSQIAELDRFFENVDIYNHHDPAIAPNIARKPRYQIDVGLDHKIGLLKKAHSTGLYRQLLEADANGTFPLESDSYRTVYSNILYWLEDYPHALRETSRIVAPGGQVVLQVPNETFRNYSFYQRLHVARQDPSWAWLKLLDRGRSENIKHCKSKDGWLEEFHAAGLQMVAHRQYLSKVVLEAWDIGLRPISPYLIRMANSMAPDDRKSVKADWVNGLMPLVEPLCKLEWDSDDEFPPGFHLFVLTKS